MEVVGVWGISVGVMEWRREVRESGLDEIVSHLSWDFNLIKWRCMYVVGKKTK